MKGAQKSAPKLKLFPHRTGTQSSRPFPRPHGIAAAGIPGVTLRRRGVFRARAGRSGAGFRAVSLFSPGARSFSPSSFNSEILIFGNLPKFDKLCINPSPLWYNT
jgi:hypothetical protein